MLSGFLSLQNDSIPGNAGMLDMILALEWVQENIVWFGGDASKVTIVGQSAGGAAVSSLLVSPLTRNRGKYTSLASVQQEAGKSSSTKTF